MAPATGQAVFDHLKTAASIAIVIAVPASLVSPARATAPAPRVLIFFSSLCYDCRRETGQIVAWVADHPRAQITGVGFMESLETAGPFAREAGFRFPIVADPEGVLRRRFKVAQPDAIVILRGGTVVSRTYLRPDEGPARATSSKSTEIIGRATPLSRG